jgi:hypothetical protein
MSTHRWLFFQLTFYILFDLLVCALSLGFYHSNELHFDVSAFVAQFSSYTILQSGVDLLALALLRFGMLIVGVHLLYTGKAIACYETVVTAMVIGTNSFALVKVLCFAESPNQLKFVGVWMSVLWTLGASGLFFGLWNWRLVEEDGKRRRRVYR